VSEQSEDLSYEESLRRLDETLRALEDGTLTLEEAIEAVARGKDYLRHCQQKLDEARRRIEPPHPASVSELRAAGPRPAQDEIPF